ncbi:MAG: hypothetical protein ACXAD7_23110 [Candidatus Kariarchaeaceae archaeon]|jgi:hypothetical protein
MSFARSGQLSVQKASDFFKSATRNISIVIWLVRILALGFLFLLISRVYGILNDEVTEIDNLYILLDIIILFFFVIILALLTLVAFIVVPLGNSVDPTGNVAAHYFFVARAFIIKNIFGSVDLIEGFDKEIFFGTGQDPLAPMAYLLNKPQRILYNTQTMYGMILFCFALMLITGIGFIRRSSVSLAGATLVLSQFVIGLAYMKNLTVDLSLETDTISDMLGSKLFQLALISYLYFEFSLQTGYLYSLASPALSRQQRVGKQLSKLSEFRLGITKLGTEEQKEQAEAKKERIEDKEDEVDDRTSTALATGAGSTSEKKFNADALIFLLDSAQDSLFAKPGGDQERLTGRLQRYHDGLLAHDPKIDEKLGGSAGKSFNPFMVLVVVISSMAFRIALLIGFSWIALNPSKLLDFIALPETITNSIEINEPEGILLVLIPLIFFILGASFLVAKAQDWLIKAEELIIKEADIQRLLKAGKRITGRKDAEMAQKAVDDQIEKERQEQLAEQPQVRRRRKRRSRKKS